MTSADLATLSFSRSVSVVAKIFRHAHEEIGRAHV